MFQPTTATNSTFGPGAACAMATEVVNCASLSQPLLADHVALHVRRGGDGAADGQQREHAEVQEQRQQHAASSPWAPKSSALIAPACAQADGAPPAPPSPSTTPTIGQRSTPMASSVSSANSAARRPAQRVVAQRCRPASVRWRSPARPPPRPCRAARRPPSAASCELARTARPAASTITSGTHSSPASAAAAPRQPKKRSPIISAMLTMFGPGSTWPSDSSSRNCAGVSQRSRSTSSRCATASTPPKPCSARRLKTRKISSALRGAALAARRAGGSDMRAAAHAPRRPQAGAQRRAHPGQRHPAQRRRSRRRRSSRRRWPRRRTGPGTWPTSSARSAPWPAPARPAPAAPAAPSSTRSSPAPTAR